MYECVYEYGDWRLVHVGMRARVGAGALLLIACTQHGTGARAGYLGVGVRRDHHMVLVVRRMVLLEVLGVGWRVLIHQLPYFLFFVSDVV